MVYEAQLRTFAHLVVWEFSFRVVKQHIFHQNSFVLLAKL